MTNTPKYGFTTTLLSVDSQKTAQRGAAHRPTRATKVCSEVEKWNYYGRPSSPAVATLEEKITEMEEGVGSVCFASGMANIAALGQAFLMPGDHFVSSIFSFSVVHST